MNKQKKESESKELPVLAGQLTLDDIIGNADDGTYGNPADEFIVEANAELRI